MLAGGHQGNVAVVLPRTHSRSHYSRSRSETYFAARSRNNRTPGIAGWIADSQMAVGVCPEDIGYMRFARLTVAAAGIVISLLLTGCGSPDATGNPLKLRGI